MSMCFMREWFCGSRLAAIVPKLLQNSELACFCVKLSSCMSERVHSICLAACVNATYSASVEDRVMIPCCLDDQAIGPPPISTMYPHTDFLSSPCAQSESVNVLKIGYGSSLFP